jgi:hypothetical protein
MMYLPTQVVRKTVYIMTCVTDRDFARASYYLHDLRIDIRFDSISTTAMIYRLNA